jgi:hypothetical protein
MNKLLTALILSITALTAQADVVYRKASGGDSGTYTLISAKQTAQGTIVAIGKREGLSGTGWTRTESNCQAGKMREIGYTEKSANSIPTDYQSRWFDLVQGSSKSDLFNYLCRK